MRKPSTMARVALRLAALALLVLASELPASADCNVKPGREEVFASSLGATSRPFAAPGEALEIRMRDCDESEGFALTGADYLVSVAFKPVGGTARLVVLGTSPGSASCVEGPARYEQVLDPNRLRVVVNADAGDRRLQLAFPDTDVDLGVLGDDLTLSGPAVIAVTPTGVVPCELLTSSCTALKQSLGDDLIACIDEFFRNDGACGTDIPNPSFTSFTALPIPNVFREACFRDGLPPFPPGPCLATANELRAAVDEAGNLLQPVDWTGIFPAQDGGPIVGRLVRGRFKPDLDLPFRVPSQVFLSSYSPEGIRLRPILEPQLGASDPIANEVTIFGSADAPYGILRFARRHGTCDGGPRDGERCNNILDCVPGGTCPLSCVDAPQKLCQQDADCGTNGPCGSLFDVSAVVSGGGPFVLERAPSGEPGFCQVDQVSMCTIGAGGQCAGAPGDTCARYALEALRPEVLECPVATDDLRTFWASELVDLNDRNGDGDTNDTVITLRERDTGATQEFCPPVGCGIPGDADGRSLVVIRYGQSTYPALDAEDDLLAFLEPESLIGDDSAGDAGCDQNGNKNFYESFVRVFRLGGCDLMPESTPADPAPLLNGKPLVISAGRVFFRTPEAAVADHVTTLASKSSSGVQSDAQAGTPTISVNGRYVVFHSAAMNLVADANGSTQVYRHDRVTGQTIAVSRTTGGTLGGAPSNIANVSADGNRIVFVQGGGGLLLDSRDSSSVQDAYFTQVSPPYTSLVSLNHSNTQSGNGVSLNPWIAQNGRYVAFESVASNLVLTDTNGSNRDIFVRDLNANQTTIASLTHDGLQASVENDEGLAISADGRFVAFVSAGTNLTVEPDTNGLQDVFVRDRCIADGSAVAGCVPTTTRVSIRPDGSDFVPAGDEAPQMPSLSADGRFVAFRTISGFALRHTYVHDRSRRRTTRITTNSGNNPTAGSLPFISADGRFVALYAANADFVSGDNDGNFEAFVFDRASGSVAQASVLTEDGSPGGLANSPRIGISGDGRAVAFASTGFVSPDANGSIFDVYVRSVDPSPANVAANDLFPDGTLDDTILQFFDADANPPAITRVCAANEVAIVGNRIAFLRPESATGALPPPIGKCAEVGSLNRTGAGEVPDVQDEVPYLSTDGGDTFTNLARAATAIALSDKILAALVPELEDQDDFNDDPESYNTDNDVDDEVVQVFNGTAWINVGRAAQSIEVTGDKVIFLTPETSEAPNPPGSFSLNGDGDSRDRVLHLFDASINQVVNTAQAAEEFVIGEPGGTPCGTVQLVAFRTNECAQGGAVVSAECSAGGADLNLDGDADDDVLQLYDIGRNECLRSSHPADCLINTRQAVLPLLSCDPERPYEVSGSQARLLTFEGDQGGLDLNNDGSNDDIVVQTFDACTTAISTAGDVAPQSGDSLADRGEGQLMQADAGRCVEPGKTCANCSRGSLCDQALDRCILAFPGSCRPDKDDCPLGADCIPELVVAVTGADDRDQDGVPDAADSCADDFNPAQADSDGDGVGDACDQAPLPCAEVALTGCRAPTESRRSILVLKDGTPDRTDLLTWRWSSGQETTIDDLGDPLRDEAYALCLYDSSSDQQPRLVAHAPADGLCGNRPCWKALRNDKGFVYTDRFRTPDGIGSLQLRTGIDGKAKVLVKAGQERLAMPALDDLVLPLRMQLQSVSGECWEATFSGAARHDAEVLQTISD